ncbi:MAG: hypothetical protein JWM92_95 [Candidatus Nomurabacteria bacterium]|nr:hypothetical protein [Candidatus Nomurabacteria bacterium]
MKKKINKIIHLWHVLFPFHSKNMNEFIAMAKKESFELIRIEGKDIVVCTAQNLEGRTIIYRENCFKKGALEPKEIIEKLKKGLPYTQIIEYMEIPRRYSLFKVK